MSLFGSYGEMLFRLPGTKFHDADFEKCKLKKVSEMKESCRRIMFRHETNILSSKFFLPYERYATSRVIFITRRDLNCKRDEIFSRYITEIPFHRVNRPLSIHTCIHTVSVGKK